MSTTLSSRHEVGPRATDQKPGIHPAATAEVVLVDRAERRLLERAMAGGGSCAIEGLAGEDMVTTASVALMLQWRGLVRAKIHFTQGVPGQPELVHVELTEDGLQCLAAELSTA